MTSYRDWVVELSNTTGTVPYALAGAPAGTSYFTFRQRYPDGADEVVFWAVNKDRTKWEKNQLTTLTYGEPDLLTRHVVESSNGDAPVPWTSDDLPLRIYVVPDADAEQGAITGWLATVRHRLLRFGIWFKKDYPTAGINTPMVYDGAVDTPLGVVPPGSVLPFAGATEPLGFLFCFGQAISRTTYAALFAAIGTAYGSGDGTTTFNVPDLRGRVAAGRGDMGTTDAGRLTATTMSPNGTTLGATGGAQTNTANTSMTSTGSTNGALSVSVSGSLGGSADPSGQEVAAAASGSGASAVSHGHGVTVTGTLGGVANGTLGVTVGGNANSSAFGIVQPTIILNHIIKT